MGDLHDEFIFKDSWWYLMHKRVDSNQTEIINAAKKIGASVCFLSDIGKGFPDVLIGYRSHNFLIEIKRPGRRNKLTKAQEPFHNAWKGKIYIVETVDEILDILTRDI